MKNNYTTEEVNGLLEGYNERLFPVQVTEYAKDMLNKFKKDKGLLPTLEVGKWYQDRLNTYNTDAEICLFCITKISETGNLYGYGFNDEKWSVLLEENGATCMYNNTASKYLVEVTDKEVEEALIAEAKRRGFELDTDLIVDLTPIDKTWHSKQPIKVSDITYSAENNMLNFGGIVIFRDGKWATIIEENKELTALEDQYKIMGEKIQALKNK